MRKSCSRDAGEKAEREARAAAAASVRAIERERQTLSQARHDLSRARQHAASAARDVVRAEAYARVLQERALAAAKTSEADAAAAAAEEAEAELEQLRGTLEKAEAAVATAEAAAEAQLALIDGLEGDLHALQRQRVELGASCGRRAAAVWEGSAAAARRLPSLPPQRAGRARACRALLLDA